MLPVEVAVSKILKSLGYKKKGLNWWLARSDTIQVFNIQKSAFGEELYFNLALYHRALGNEETPPEYRCHIRARLTELVPSQSYEAVKAATKLGEPSAELLSAIYQYGLTWLDSLSTAPGRQAFFASPLAKRVAVNSRIEDL